MPSLPSLPKPKRASRSPPLGDGAPLHVPVQGRISRRKGVRLRCT